MPSPRRPSVRETERAKAEANARLAREVADMRAEAERRRGVELEEMRTQVSRLRDAAAEHARSAAAAAVAAEVARAKTVNVPQPVRRAPEMFVQAAPVSSRKLPRMLVPIAASLLVIAAGGYTLGLGPAIKGTTKAAITWLQGLTTGDKPEEAQNQAPPVAAETPRKAATRRTAPSSSSSSPSVGAGEIRVQSTPSGAEVLLDGKSRGTAPIDLKDVPAGTHTVQLQGANGTVKTTVTVRAGARATVDETIAPGFLTIVSRIPLEIYLGGRRLGTSEDEKISLPPGAHRLTVVNAKFGFRSELSVEIKPGELTAYNASPATGRIIVHTAAGAEILIEGEKVGVAPMGELEVPVGVREKSWCVTPSWAKRASGWTSSGIRPTRSRCRLATPRRPRPGRGWGCRRSARRPSREASSAGAAISRRGAWRRTAPAAGR